MSVSSFPSPQISKAGHGTGRGSSRCYRWSVYGQATGDASGGLIYWNCGIFPKGIEGWITLDDLLASQNDANTRYFQAKIVSSAYPEPGSVNSTQTERLLMAGLINTAISSTYWGYHMRVLVGDKPFYLGRFDAYGTYSLQCQIDTNTNAKTYNLQAHGRIFTNPADLDALGS